MAFTLYNAELYNQEDEISDDEENSHLEGPNPHLYMSVEGAKYILEGAAIALSELYPQYAAQIRANMGSASTRLDELAAEMRAIAADAAGGRAIVMNEALVYVAEELGLEIAGSTTAKAASRSTRATRRIALHSSRPWTPASRWWKSRAPPSLTEALEGAGYIVARLDVLSTLRADMGAEGYFAAQRENAQAVAAAFAQAEGNELKQVEIYTDGACSGNPGPGGWAAILIYRDKRAELSGYEAHTTNNRMELMAAIRGLRALKEPCAVRLYSDSTYLVNAFEKKLAAKTAKAQLAHRRQKARGESGPLAGIAHPQRHARRGMGQGARPCR